MKGIHLRSSRDRIAHAMNYLSTEKPLVVVGMTLALLVLIGIVDYLTGYELGFFVFYFIPIALGAWYVNRGAAIMLSLGSTLTWFVVDLISDKPYSWWFYRYWDGAIRCVSFVAIAMTISKIRELLTEAFSEIRQLRSLLPICAACKRIRDDTGYWERVEIYMGNHYSVEFSHTICPECGERLYPHLYDDLP